MTDKQINAAIAGACGWVIPPNPPTGYFPNYCNDLNAMHEAEIWFINNLMPQDWESYRNKLLWTRGYYDVHAKARQRAEAFLRALGKWEEKK